MTASDAEPLTEQSPAAAEFRNLDGRLQTEPPKPWAADVSLLIVALIWGVNIPLMKSGLDRMDWFAFNAVRLSLSALVLAWFGWREWQRGSRPARGLLWHQVMIFSLLASVVYQLLFLLGISRTTSGNSSLILSTVPMWTAINARLFLQERLSHTAWFGLWTALGGTMIVALQKPDLQIGRETLLGNVCVLGAALSWSASTVYSRPLMKSISPLQLSASSALLSLPVHLLLAATYSREGGFGELQQPVVWLTVIYAGLFSTGLALPMWNFGVRHSGAAHAAVFQNLIPVTALIAAWGIRGEAVTSPQLLGGAMIIGGLLIMRLGR